MFKDHNKFKSYCLKWEDEYPLIKEFYHLFELYDLRKNCNSLQKYPSFYFKEYKKDDLSRYEYEAIYIERIANAEISTEILDVFTKNSLSNICIKKDLYIIEDMSLYNIITQTKLIEGDKPTFIDYLNNNKKKFRIKSIQTSEDISKSIIINEYEDSF